MAPQYRRVADDLRDRLARREWGVGEKIPGISALQEHYGIASLNTVRRAQAILIEEGLLRSEQGRGVYVVAHPGYSPTKDRKAEALQAIDEAMRLLALARRGLAA